VHVRVATKVKGFTFNSYAKTLGVQTGWTLVKVGNVDVTCKTNYSEVKRLINDGLEPYPCWPFKIELARLDDDGLKASPCLGCKKAHEMRETGERKLFYLVARPLGFQFDTKAPIRVKKVNPDSYAESLGMKGYVKDNETWIISKINESDWPPEDNNFPKLLNMLEEGTRALDPFSSSDGMRSVDQLKGWDD